ncbi:MAG: IS110 family transposase [Chitinivibrionales bacterium]|nr:IS110 family transposase [Chitinivibrionales bacterium]
MTDYFMGCDVSKGYADFVILDKQKRIVEAPFQLDDTFEGHGALSEFLSSFFRRHKGATINFGVESTGGYENNWYSLLVRLHEVYPLKVARLNPLGVKKHHEATMKSNITDPIAAHNIASYMISYPEKVCYNEDMAFQSMRRQWNTTQLLVKQRSQLLNNLESLMYLSHPELIRYCKHGVPQWVFEVLSAYPTASKLANARIKKLTSIPSVTIAKAQTIIEETKKSVASHIDETSEFMVRETVIQIKNLTESIERHKHHLEKTCNLPEVDLLSSFTGIGTYSALGLLIYIVSVARFPTVKHLVSYFGLNPAYKQSGDGSWGYHISKQGHARPRAVLFMVSFSATQYNPVIKELYNRCIDSGMPRMAALGVCMHKILRIIYGMLKTNKPFDPVVDEKNRKIKRISTSKKKEDKHRRYQSRDEKAPISRRQTKTRREKERKEPQVNGVHKSGVIPSLTHIKSNICTDHAQINAMPQSVGEILAQAMAAVVEKK